MDENFDHCFCIMLTLSDLETMTKTDGEGWGLAHVKRVLHLIDLIGFDLSFDRFALTIATYLHDWAAFPRYRQAGIGHALRSRQLAEAEILPQMNLPATTRPIIMEAIERHDYRDLRPVSSLEALLLREADFLDFLGVIGLTREFAWGPNNLEICLQQLLARRAIIETRFTLPVAQQLAAIPLE